MSAPIPDVDPLLVVERGSGVATVTFNRPQQYNVLSEEMLTALQSTFDTFAEDTETQVIVLRAMGRAFCAGHDLKQMRATTDEAYYQRLFTQCSQFMQTVLTIPQPVIAEVQGITTAAGCQLVATCDLAVASRSAQFAVSGINIGLFCSTPAVALSRNVNRKKAFEMLITGDFVDAETALERGLINQVCEDDELTSCVNQLVAKICAKPPVAIRTGKQMFYRQLEMGLADAYRLAGDAMAQNMMASDTLEGVDAFIEKRPPNWQSPDS